MPPSQTIELASLVFDEVLSRLPLAPAQQPRFFNTLSFLEYIGARKILKSQPEEGVSLGLLAHAAEELRHAKALKRLSLRLSGATESGYASHELIAGDAARDYFQGLDEEVATSVAADYRLAYLYVTLLIEERALLVYPRLMAALRDPWVEAVGRGILAEEERHLSEVRSQLAALDPD